MGKLCRKLGGELTDSLRVSFSDASWTATDPDDMFGSKVASCGVLARDLFD